MDHIKRFEDKLDKVVEKQAEMGATLSAQHTSLQEHMRRTTLIENQLMPIKTQADMIKGAVKLLALIGIIIGIVEGIHRISH